MSAGLAMRLREHKVASAFSAPQDFVFASETGGPLDRHNVSRRALGKCVRAKLDTPGSPRLDLHCLRHTFASHAILDLGIDPVSVSRMLGHSRPSVTVDAYCDLFDQARHSQDIRDRMDASALARALES